ncbi:MAG: hypothetical protein ACRCUI_11465, partial [Polymorphobacter sp.]
MSCVIVQNFIFDLFIQTGKIAMKPILMLTTSVLTISISSMASAGEKEDIKLIKYSLPATSVSLELALTLESCSDKLAVSGKARLVASPGQALPGAFALTSNRLESARVKRAVGITLHDTGTIATINSAAEDRSGAIIGNVFKFAAQVAGAVLGLNVKGPVTTGGA